MEREREEAGKNGRESFLDEQTGHAIDTIIQCRVVLVFQSVE